MLEAAAAAFRDNPSMRTVTMYENNEPLFILTREDVVHLYLAHEFRMKG